MIAALVLILCLWVMFLPTRVPLVVFYLAAIIGAVMLGLIFPEIDETMAPITRSWFAE